MSNGDGNIARLIAEEIYELNVQYQSIIDKMKRLDAEQVALMASIQKAIVLKSVQLARAVLETPTDDAIKHQDIVREEIDKRVIATAWKQYEKYVPEGRSRGSSNRNNSSKRKKSAHV